MKTMTLILLGLMFATLNSCVIDNTGSLEPADDDDSDVGDDDSAAAGDDDTGDDDATDNEVCPGSYVRYTDIYYRDVDGNGCLSRFERDDPNSDQWVSVAVCGDGTFSTTWSEGDVAPGLPSAPFLNSNDPSTWCSEEAGDDDDVADDDDSTPADDDDSTPAGDDDDASGDDDSASGDDDDAASDDELVEVVRTGFTGAWDLRIFNWDLFEGAWWGMSPEYCAYGIGSDLGCYVEIMAGDRFSINGVIAAGGWLVTAAPADFVNEVSVNGVTYPITESRSSSPAVGPWTDVPMGTCRYGAPGNNDIWCRGASAL